MTTEPTDEQIATVLRERFQADLLALIQRPEYTVAPFVTVNGLIEVVGVLLKGLGQQNPRALPVLLQEVDHLRTYVQSAEVAGQPPSTH